MLLYSDTQEINVDPRKTNVNNLKILTWVIKGETKEVIKEETKWETKEVTKEEVVHHIFKTSKPKLLKKVYI